MKKKYVSGLSICFCIMCSAILSTSCARVKKEEIRIELCWEAIADAEVDVNAEVHFITKSNESTNYNPYDFIEIEKEANRSIVTIKKAEGIYDFDVCALGPYFNNALSDVEMEAHVYLPGETTPLVYEYSEDEIFRSYTGVWLWGPFSIRDGKVDAYDQSWMTLPNEQPLAY